MLSSMSLQTYLNQRPWGANTAWQKPSDNTTPPPGTLFIESRDNRQTVGAAADPLAQIYLTDFSSNVFFGNGNDDYFEVPKGMYGGEEGRVPGTAVTLQKERYDKEFYLKIKDPSIFPKHFLATHQKIGDKRRFYYQAGFEISWATRMDDNYLLVLLGGGDRLVSPPHRVLYGPAGALKVYPLEELATTLYFGPYSRDMVHLSDQNTASGSIQGEAVIQKPLMRRQDIDPSRFTVLLHPEFDQRVEIVPSLRPFDFT